MAADDAEILEAVGAAFAPRPRPEHFTNYLHCDECREHDDLLRSRDPDTLRHEDVGNPGWDPLCFTSPEGFAYLFPGLARLALDEPDQERGWYPEQLLFHLNYEGEKNRHLAAFSAEERQAVASLLRHLQETRRELAEAYWSSVELSQAIALWSDDDARGGHD